MRFLSSLSGVGMALLLSFVPGCGGGSSEPPAIASFVAHPATVQQGGTTRLTAHFSGGAGRIEPGVGAVTSGVPVDVVVADDTVYALSVTGDGETVRAAVEVKMVFDQRWDFADGAGWQFQGDVSVGGALTLRAYIDREPFPQTPPTQGCTGARASTSFGDAKMAAGRYEHISVELRGVAPSGLLATRRVIVRYHGRHALLDMLPGPSEPRTFRVEWAQTGNPTLFIDDSLAGELRVVPTSASDGIELSLGLCPRPFPEPGGSAQWRVDGITVSAR